MDNLIDKIVKYVLDNKRIFISIFFDWIPITLLSISSVLYPIWWMEGTLDGDNIFEEIYLKVGVAIASYGGLIANIIWMIRRK